MLLLFAQTLEEMLFDYTIDSYKARALNLHTSLRELRFILKQVINGRISSGTLVPLLEEFQDKMRNDPVIEGSSRFTFDVYAERLAAEREGGHIKQMLDTVNALALELHQYYWRELLQAISKAVRIPRCSRRIIALADSFVAEAELQGYHRSIIYYAVSKYFWRQGISRVDAIDQFLSAFDGNIQQYSFVFRADKSFSTISEFGPPLRIRITKEKPSIPEHGKKVTDFLSVNEEYPLYLIVSQIEAKDPLKARLRAEAQIEALADVYSYHVHKREPRWMRPCLCLNGTGKVEGLLNPPLAPMKKRPKHTFEESKDEIDRTISTIAGVHFHPASSRLFMKAIDYHRAAIEATTPENQLVDLWAALEGFLPPPDPDTTRITHYVGVVSPSLSLTYPTKLFSYLSESLAKYGAQVVDILEKIPIDGNQFDKTVAITVCEDLSAYRSSLFSLLDRDPALRFRCYTLNEQFRTAKRTYHTIFEHKRRVSWHLQRVYTTRNQIVHNAESMPYLSTLVENLHFYVDTLVSSAMQVGVQTSLRATIQGVLKLMSVQEQSYLRSLKDSDARCTTENFRKLLFGESNPLSPYNTGLTL